jgi:hypothetical protein
VKWLLLGALVALLAFAALVAFAPERREIVRETTIAATPADVHALLEDLRRWGAWSPWRALGGGAPAVFSGPERGVDARATWTGADGTGELVVTASEPARGLWYDVSLMNSRHEGLGKLTAKGVFQYAEVGGGTRVVWSNAVPLRGVPARLLGYGLERWLAPALEAGLADLKRAVEAPR